MSKGFFLEVRDFCIEEPYQQTIPVRIRITRDNGEAGEFLKDDFDKAVYQAVEDFFNENF